MFKSAIALDNLTVNLSKTLPQKTYLRREGKSKTTSNRMLGTPCRNN